MGLKRQIFVNIICFLLSFIYIRCFLSGIKTYQLNNSAYKKRKKGETFKEWLFYSRYKEEIPKILRVLYYSFLIIHLACLITCLFAYIITLSLNIGFILTMSMFYLDAACMFVIQLLFWSPRQRKMVYERWITKKRGQKRK